AHFPQLRRLARPFADERLHSLEIGGTLVGRHGRARRMGVRATLAGRKKGGDGEGQEQNGSVHGVEGEVIEVMESREGRWQRPCRTTTNEPGGRGQASGGFFTEIAGFPPVPKRPGAPSGWVSGTSD